jgi:hypothetical protein
MTSLLDRYIEDLCEKHEKDFSRVANELMTITGSEGLPLDSAMIESRYRQLKQINTPHQFLSKYMPLAKLPSSLEENNDDDDDKVMVIPAKFKDLSNVRFDDILRDDLWGPTPETKTVDPYLRSLGGRKTDPETRLKMPDSDDEAEQTRGVGSGLEWRTVTEGLSP